MDSNREAQQQEMEALAAIFQDMFVCVPLHHRAASSNAPTAWSPSPPPPSSSSSSSSVSSSSSASSSVASASSSASVGSAVASSKMATVTFRGEISVQPTMPASAGVRLRMPTSDDDNHNNDSNDGYGSDDRVVQHLAPIVVHFRLTEAYPSAACPHFKLTCIWLTDSQLRQLSKQLQDMWAPDQIVLYEWSLWLQNEALLFLEVEDLLDLSRVVAEKPGTSISSLYSRLLEYDAEMDEKNFQSLSYQCGICLEEHAGKFSIRFVSCRHVFCRECVSNYFSFQIEDSQVRQILCPDPKCKKAVLSSEVLQVSGQELYSRYESLLLKAALETMTDIIWCPRQSCQSPVIRDEKSGLGFCTVCSYAFCIFCKHSYHGVAPCNIKDFESVREQYMNGTAKEKEDLEKRYGRARLVAMVDESLTKEWKRQNSTPCPKCHTDIQKIEGCNKMTCTTCQSYFCYRCGALLNSQSPYSHFSIKGTPCNGKLFDMDEIDDNDDDFL